MSIESYKDLLVWQRSIELTKEIYSLVKKLPKEETYALSDQMRRAAVSIPSNTAEGQERHGTKEYINFLSIARGSKAELETQIIICRELNYLTEEETTTAMNLITEISKMLASLIKKLTPTP